MDSSASYFNEAISSVEAADRIPQEIFKPDGKMFVVRKVEAMGKNPRPNANSSKLVNQIEFTEADEVREQL